MKASFDTDNTKTWSNWAGNHHAHPQEIHHPTEEAEIAEIIATATARGLDVRTVGAGHSFSDICASDGVMMCLDRMTGVLIADAVTNRVVSLPGTRIRDFGDPLWKAGLCLRNQGDIDAQHIVGAMATATHGSGIEQQSFSATARRFRVVLASGEILEIDDSTPDLLAAMQVSVGLLGVVTQVEFDVRPAFGIKERIEYWTNDEVLERWDEEMAQRRHFSFFWMPYADSPDTLFMDYPTGMNMADRSMVKLYDEVPADSLDGLSTTPGRRVDRPYRIYPDPDFEGEIVNRELEYYVPFAAGKDAFMALRSLILGKYPNDKYPVEVRSIGADSAYLSPFYERDSIAVSICGREDLNYRDFLADVARTLDPFDARTHWGKVHYMDQERLRKALPRFADFQAVRHRLDPAGTFLTPRLRELFA